MTERLTTPFDPCHVEFDISAQSTSTNSAFAQQCEKLCKVIEKLVRYALLDEATPIHHPAIIMMINADGLLTQAQQILNGQNQVQPVEIRPQLQPRGGRA